MEGYARLNDQDSHFAFNEVMQLKLEYDIMTQETEREQILKLVTEYADKYISTKAIPDLDNGRVLVSGKVIGNQEIANMVDACLDGWLTSEDITINLKKH